jgi:hypothetical protein
MKPIEGESMSERVWIDSSAEEREELLLKQPNSETSEEEAAKRRTASARLHWAREDLAKGGMMDGVEQWYEWGEG